MSVGATPLASVIIPARNAADTLPDQLEALSRQNTDAPFEVLVVDNGSTDRTVEIANGFTSAVFRLRLLTCERAGANAARNVGGEAASSELLLFCDADDIVDASWVGAMIAALQEQDAVGGRIDNDTFPPGFMPRYPEGMPRAAGFLPRAITANFGVRRKVWESIGGFSESYGYGATDTEFCWRLQLAGHRLAYAPEAVVAYRHRSTLRAAARKSYLTGRARVRLYRDFGKHGMPRSSWPGVIYRWLRLVVTSPAALVSERQRWRWVREASAAAGRLTGSLHFRVRYL